MHIAWFAVCLALLGTGCRDAKTGSKSAEPKARAPQVPTAKVTEVSLNIKGWYRVTLEGEQEVPFLFEVPGEPVAGVGTVVVANGAERISLELTCRRRSCKATFPVFGATLELGFNQDGTIHGFWRRPSYLKRTDVKLNGVRIEAGDPEHLFPIAASQPIDLSGTWRMEIDGVGLGRAEFEQRPNGIVTGSILPQDIGDTRFLVGRVTEAGATLTTFDGQHAYRIEMSATEEGIEGTWHYPEVWHYPFKMSRAAPPTIDELHTLRVSGNRIDIPELKPFLGRPVVVDIFGTWCPACMDLTPTLVDLHNRYKDRGLEVLSIALELEADPRAAEERVDAFKNEYRIPWNIAIRHGEDSLNTLPRELENARGFPITIFVHRDGTVEGVHSGFVSEAHPLGHREVLAKFERMATAITESSQE